MPRIRTLKPEALQHRKVGKLSDRAFRLWVACITQADDEGRLRFDPDHFRLLAWGYQPRIRPDDVIDALLEVVGTGLVCGYLVDKSDDAETWPPTYLEFPSWPEHQRISHPSKSKLPAPNQPSILSFKEAALSFSRNRELSRGFARAPQGSRIKDRRIKEGRIKESRAASGGGARTPGTTGGPDRSSVETGSISGEDDPPGELQALAVSLNGSGPLAGVVAGVLASIAARGPRALDPVPPGHEAI